MFYRIMPLTSSAFASAYFLSVSSVSLFIPVFRMLSEIAVLITADGIVTPAAV